MQEAQLKDEWQTGHEMFRVVPTMTPDIQSETDTRLLMCMMSQQNGAFF